MLKSTTVHLISFAITSELFSSNTAGASGYTNRSETSGFAVTVSSLASSHFNTAGSISTTQTARTDPIVALMNVKLDLYSHQIVNPTRSSEMDPENETVS